MQTVAFYTLGCKTNQLETATLAHEFTRLGCQIVPFAEPDLEQASVVVLNTCTVTERADLEAKRILRRLRLSNPQAKVVVTGCYAQVAPEELAAIDGVDFVIGNQLKEAIPRLVLETPKPDKPIVQVTEMDKSRVMAGASTAGVDKNGLDRTRGSLKIQDGCDFKCTYCIIWQARGPSRCLSVADIEAQLRHMVLEGFQEIVLTGINIGQYQDETHSPHSTGPNPADLADLLETLIAVPGSFRLRLSSLDPVEVTDKLIAVVAASGGKICPHFHLSAQSAEDYVLKRMARRHHVADLQQVCQAIVQAIPHACIASDIIVGFPGETDERFAQTFNVLQQLPMHYLHVFSYSKRAGTPAADFTEQVPERIKRERARQLVALSDEKFLAYRQQFIGQTVHVITENDGQKGMSEGYIRVQLDKTLPANTLATVQISQVSPEKTHGRVLTL